MRIHRVVAVALFACAAPMALQAQTWPARPVKLIVPFPPGGTGDLLGRLAAKEMEASLGQPVVVENRAGAGQARASVQEMTCAPSRLGVCTMVFRLGMPVPSNTIASREFPRSSASATTLATASTAKPRERQ